MRLTVVDFDDRRLRRRTRHTVNQRERYLRRAATTRRNLHWPLSRRGRCGSENECNDTDRAIPHHFFSGGFGTTFIACNTRAPVGHMKTSTVMRPTRAGVKLKSAVSPGPISMVAGRVVRRAAGKSAPSLAIGVQLATVESSPRRNASILSAWMLTTRRRCVSPTVIDMGGGLVRPLTS